MSVLRSSHPNVALSPLISPAAATSSSSTSTCIAHRLLNKKNPTHTPLTPLNSPSPLRSRALSAWSTIFTAHPVTQISHRPNLLASAHEPTPEQLSILLPTVNEPSSKMTVGKRITFSESVVFSSPTPRRTFSSSSTSTDPGKPHFTLPVPISSSVLCKIAESIEAPTSDNVGNPNKKLPTSTISAYEFLVAASWAPKPRVDYGALLVASKENRKDFFRKKTIANDEFAFDATIPKIMKTQKVDAGEDAFFGTKLQNYVALGVADGVGGWVLSGVDPSEFSWSLMNNVAATAMKSPSKLSVDESAILEPIDLLETGYAQVANQREVAAGGSTACILTLCAKSGMLRSANLGDSSYLIIRDLSNVIYQPTEQQHFFNCPYQLTIVPPHERKKYKKKILSPSLTLHAPNSTHDVEPAYALDATDYDDDPTMPSNPNIKLTRPRDADIWQESLKHGDVVVLATDGFFDNVDVANECIPVVRKTLARWIAEGGLEKTTESDDKAYQMARACAKKLTELAVSHQNDPHRMTPFAKKALIHGVHYRGGKIDDVTVLVAIVRRTG